jgi:hypothetical protein
VALAAKERINRTLMTRTKRIIADKTKKFSVNTLSQRHPRSINPRTDMKSALV